MQTSRLLKLSGLLLSVLIVPLVVYGVNAVDRGFFTNSVKIGGSTPTAAASAALDINSITKGLLIPRMTEAQRDAIASPATGLMVYNTDTSAFNYYDGVGWEGIAGGFSSPMTTNGDLITQAAGIPDRLAIGASGTVLKSNGTVPAWGSITLEEARTAGSVLTGAVTLTTATTPASPSAGRLSFFAEDRDGFEEFGVIDSNGVTRTLGRDSIAIARNTTGAPITKGSVVYISGQLGARSLISLARADSMTTLPAIGVAFTDIAHNAYGPVMSVGLLEAYDTTAWDVGDVLYVSPSSAGTLTTTRPSHPDFAQPIGKVAVDGNSVNGKLLINVSPHLEGDESGTIENEFRIGDGLTSLEKVSFGTSGTLPYLGFNSTSSKIVYSHDGTTESKIIAGPASSTDDALAVWNGTGGDTLQNSSVLIDTNTVYTATSLNFDGVTYLPNGPPNFVGNWNAIRNTTGWTEYDDGAVAVDGTGGSPSVLTIGRIGSSLIRGSTYFYYSKTAADGQGEGVAYALTLDAAETDASKQINVSFQYLTSAAYASGDVVLYVYDATGGIRPLQCADGTSTLYASSTTTKATCRFYTTPTVTSYRLILHVATTNASAYAVSFGDVRATPEVSVPGYIGDEWKSFTPTGSWVANSTYTGKWRRVGDSIEVLTHIALSGAPTSAGLTVNLPSGLTIDTTKLLSTTGSVQTIEGGYRATDTGNNAWDGFIAYSSTTAIALYRPLTASGDAFAEIVTGNTVTQAAPFTFGNGDFISIRYKVPIANWQASAALSTTETLLSTQQAIVGGDAASATSGNIIIFPTRTYDPNSSYNASTGRFTAAAPGTLNISGTVQLNGGGASALFVYVNGVQGPAVTGFNAANDVSNINGAVRVNRGDLVDIRPNATVDLTVASYVSFYLQPTFSVFATYPSDRWYVNAMVTGGNPNLGGSAVSSYTEIIDGGLTLTPISGSAPVGTMCSTTNAATAPSTGATTCAIGFESLGINFHIPEPGVYEVCAQFTNGGGVDTGEVLFSTFQLIETPLAAQTLTLESGARINTKLKGMTIASGTAAEMNFPHNLCGLFDWSSASTGTNKGVRLMYEQAVTGSVNSSNIIADADASTGQRNLHWRVRKY